MARRQQRTIIKTAMRTETNVINACCALCMGPPADAFDFLNPLAAGGPKMVRCYDAVRVGDFLTLSNYWYAHIRGGCSLTVIFEQARQRLWSCAGRGRGRLQQRAGRV